MGRVRVLKKGGLGVGVSCVCVRGFRGRSRRLCMRNVLGTQTVAVACGFVRYYTTRCVCVCVVCVCCVWVVCVWCELLVCGVWVCGGGVCV